MPVLRLVLDRCATAGAPSRPPRSRAARPPSRRRRDRRSRARPRIDVRATERKMLYEGSPSWKAYLGHYLHRRRSSRCSLIAILRWIARHRRAGDDEARSTSSIPIAVARRVLLRHHVLSQVDQVPRHQHGDRVRARPAVEAHRRAAAVARPRRRLQAEPRRSHPRHRARRGRRAGRDEPRPRDRRACRRRASCSSSCATRSRSSARPRTSYGVVS